MITNNYKGLKGRKGKILKVTNHFVILCDGQYRVGNIKQQTKFNVCIMIITRHIFMLFYA